jgi:hypothetical protein
LQKRIGVLSGGTYLSEADAKERHFETPKKEKVESPIP